MPGTRRRPVNRPPEPPITVQAIRIFDAMKRCRCTCPPDVAYHDCEGCEKWWELHNQLCAEVNARPWQWPCVQNPNAPGNDPKPDEAQELWRKLDAASTALRKALRQKRATNESAQPPA
jgi:hypothetical protein